MSRRLAKKNVEVCLHSCEVVQMSFQIDETFPVIFQHYVEWKMIKFLWCIKFQSSYMVDHLTHWALGFDAPTSQYFYLGMCSFHRLVGRSHANRRYVLSVLLLLNFLYSLLLFFVGYTHNQWRAIAHEKKVPEKVFSSPTIRELQLAHIFRDLASKLNHLRKKCVTYVSRTLHS